MKTQTALICEHLLSGKTLTQLQAYKKPFLCVNLSGRIAELRKNIIYFGVPYKIESPKVKQPSGKWVSVYRLIKP
jgi:hypothetical protein